MQVIIKTRGLELTDGIKKFVEEKFLTLKKFINILKQDTPDGLKTLAEVFVELEKETKHHKNGDIFRVKARLVLPGKSLTAVEESDDFYKTIVATKDELKLEIEKYKVKKIDANRREHRKSKRA